MPKYTALRQLTGDYGVVGPGDAIEITDPKIAEDLEAGGLIAKGHKKLTDSVLAKAAEKAAAVPQQPDVEAPPSGATELDEKAVQGATENKAASPKSNKKS